MQRRSMNWTDFGWMGFGLALGFGLRWQWRSPTALPAVQFTQATDPAEPHQLPTVQELPTVQALQLAYQLATELNQFKGGFLARTSHELRSPLNGMIGMQQLILSDLCDSAEEEREFIAQSNQSALKMIKVLDTVLEVARLEHGTLKMELQPLQLASLLQTIHDLTYLQAADRNLQFSVALPDPELYILADPKRLKQVLLHLIDEPIAQMQEGSVAVSVQVSAETGYAHIWIDSDRAAPLSEPIDLLQTPAETTAIPSAGLNLLTSQMLVSLMQGTLTVSSLPPTSTDDAECRQRLQCSLPLVALEPE